MGAKCENVQTSSYKINKAWEVTYNMMTSANVTALHILKLSRMYILKSLSQEKNL